MENNITLTDTVYKRLPYILLLSACLLLLTFSRTKLEEILAELPSDNYIDFAMDYIMKSESHAVIFSFLAFLLTITIFVVSTVFLIKDFMLHDKRAKIVDSLLILANIGLAIFAIIISKVLLYIIFSILLCFFFFAIIFGGLGSSRDE